MTPLSSATDGIVKNAAIINMLYVEIVSGRNTLCKGTNQS